MGSTAATLRKEEKERLEDRFYLRTCLTRVAQLPEAIHEFEPEETKVHYRYSVSWIFCNCTAVERNTGNPDEIGKILLEIYEKDAPKVHTNRCAIAVAARLVEKK